MSEYKIMIVDDEPDILDLLEKALTIEGFHNILKVDNGNNAVSTCKEVNPDASPWAAIRKAHIRSKTCFSCVLHEDEN